MNRSRCWGFTVSIALLNWLGFDHGAHAWTPKTREPICNFMSGYLLEGESEACTITSVGSMYLNSREGKEVRFKLASSEVITIWYPYQGLDKSVCEPYKDPGPDGMYRRCSVYAKHHDDQYTPAEVHEDSCLMNGLPRRCFRVSLVSGPAILSWSVKKEDIPVQIPSISTAATRPYMMRSPVNLPGLGPEFKTYGVGAGFKTVLKIHRPILSSMVGGRNLLGNGVVQFNVLSYEPRSSYGYNFRVSVDCALKRWSFLESNASLMGGALEGFGSINGARMGPWACGRFGFRY